MSGMEPRTSSSGTQKITITLPGNELEPPVYIAGSFTENPWQAEKLELIEGGGQDGKNIYSKTFEVKPGEYQYKFRLGEGDWWILDETSTIVRDEAGNSNNQLIVKDIDKDDLPALSEVLSHDSTLPKVVNDEEKNDPEDSPLLRHESFLGTWEPDQEISPAHRRASTSLGVRISRIGTFLPPEATQEDLQDQEVEAFPTGRKNILVRMEEIRNDLAEDDSSQLEEALENDTVNDEVSKPVPSPPGVSVRSVRRPSVLVPSLDRISETHASSISYFPALADSSTVYTKAPNLGQSHGPFTTDVGPAEIKKRTGTKDDHIIVTNGASPANQAVPKSTGNGTADRRSSDSSDDSLFDEKPGYSNQSEGPHDFMFFAMIASWFRGIWNWMFGVPLQDEHEDDRHR